MRPETDHQRGPSGKILTVRSVRQDPVNASYSSSPRRHKTEFSKAFATPEAPSFRRKAMVALSLLSSHAVLNPGSSISGPVSESLQTSAVPRGRPPSRRLAGDGPLLQGSPQMDAI